MLSQQDQEMRQNVPDPVFAGDCHFCGSGAGDETRLFPGGNLVFRNGKLGMGMGIRVQRLSSMSASYCLSPRPSPLPRRPELCIWIDLTQ